MRTKASNTRYFFNSICPSGKKKTRHNLNIIPPPTVPACRRPPPHAQIKRQLHRTSSELFDTCIAHFRASADAGAAALAERLEAINAAAAASAAAASAASAPPPGTEGAGSDRTRAILSKAREAKEAAAAAAATAAVAAAAAVARKKNRKGGGAAAQELAAAVPWYGKYVPLEENALTLPEVPKVPVVEEEWRECEDGRRSSSRNVRRCCVGGGGGLEG